MRRVSGALIVGKGVWDLGGVWMRWVSGSLIVGEESLGRRKALDETVGILIAVKEVWDFGRVWMRRVRVGDY